MLPLVSDANILIDMEEGGLLVSMFSLDCRFIIPDILYEQELSEQHQGLLELGLAPKTLSPESVLDVLKLAELYKRPSRNDLFALSLARQEGCALLTGDKHLREAAEKEEIAVYGTLWLVEELVKEGKISVAIAKSAYERMRRTGRRIPWKLAMERLKKINLH